MHFHTDEIYHIFNRGNQKQRIFYNKDNYFYFLDKFKKYIVPNCEILSWCLMPNHFHIEVYANSISSAYINGRRMPTQNLVEGIRLLLSSYTKGINSRFKLTGNLFQQKTKAKSMSHRESNFVAPGFGIISKAAIAFHYIHQNPLRAGLVNRLEDWEFSSFNEFLNKSYFNICNKNAAFKLLKLTPFDFYINSYSMIPEIFLKKPISSVPSL